MRIAVIGAGLAGLSAASDLQVAGHTVVVWEKSRGAGGRTATRRTAEGLRFDHGAPFLHDGRRPLALGAALQGYDIEFGEGQTRREVVGDGANNAPAKALAGALDVRAAVRVAGIERAGYGWALIDEAGTSFGSADAVVVTAPAPQTAELLRMCSAQLAEQAATVDYDPCWAVMAAWNEPLDLPFAAVSADEDLAWAVAEAPKPGRAPGERWVLHASADFSRAHLDADASVIESLLLERFAIAAGTPLPSPGYVTAHRWRFARPRTPRAELFLREGALLAAGDWCGGDSAGDAIRSGKAAAAALNNG